MQQKLELQGDYQTAEQRAMSNNVVFALSVLQQTLIDLVEK